MKPRQWYRIAAKADDVVAEIAIYDDIGKSFWNDNAITAKQFLDDLNALPETVSKIVVRVNCMGGDVFEAVAITNGLRAQAARGRTIEMVIDGIAASSASIIIMAGDTIRIADNGIVMVHNPLTIQMGNAAAMRKTADTLDKVRDVIVSTYQWKSKLSEPALIALMDNETFMDADEAIANGFATEKVEGLKAVASIDPRAAAKLTIPEKFKARVEALLKQPEPTPAPPIAASAADILRECKAAGCLDIAEELLAANATLEQVQARTSAAKDVATAAAARVTAETGRQSEITALCATAKQPELAKAYIDGGLTVAGARAALLVVTAKLDQIEIDASIDPGKGRQKPVVDVMSSYTALAKKHN